MRLFAGCAGFPPARRATRTVLALVVGTVVLSPVAAMARTVTALSAVHRDGQTFVTWQGVGPGWRYRVYRDQRPIAQPEDLARATLLGLCDDSSAVDRRRTQVLGSLQTFRIDSAAAPLSASTGLFVHAPGAPTLAHYAVLAESAGVILDSTLISGVDRTLGPVAEWPQAPLPVWQRRTSVPADGDDYVLWVQAVPTAEFPALANLPNTATHLSLRRGIPGRPLTVSGHSRGGNSYQALIGSGYPGESILSVEDHLPTADLSAFTFGYTADYDPGTYVNPVPPAGVIVQDHIERRMLYVLDWAKRSLAYDPHRVFAFGGSMGGSLAFFLAFHHPERIAASLGVVPKLCAGFIPDSYLDLRASYDRLWGRMSDSPMGSNGVPVYQWMDGRALALRQRTVGAAPHSLFFGRADTVVGWPEKIAYVQAMQLHRIGGALFWDTRAHYDNPDLTPWRPAQTGRRMHGSRTDRSFPALSRCSADGNMGDGSLGSGDSMGTINGHVEWDTTLVDEPDGWQCVLRAVALPHRFGVFPAPDSLRVDVTPRRLQRFPIATGVSYAFEVIDLGTLNVVQSGEVTADAGGLLTVPEVRVTPSGARLRLGHPVTTVATGTLGARPVIRIRGGPLRGPTPLAVHWPGGGPARVRLFDATGRVVRTLHAGPATSVTSVLIEPRSLAAGLYWVEASQGAARATQRITVLR